MAKTELAHAKGFEIKHHENFTSLIIKSPWPESKKTYHYALVHKNMASKVTLNKDNFDGIITVPIEKMVVTSTTHIPALELLEVENTLIGFPGTDYISSEKTRARVDNGSIRELGKNEGINTEVLLEIRPDVVIGFGMDNNNKSFDNIKKAGIPVIYNGDWVEHSPLAKAEWIKFFGVLYNKRTEADSIYNTIEKNYLEAKALASDAKNKPTVLSGAMHKDMWYLPNGTSTEAQILKDAHVDYLWSETEGVGSLSLNFEVVFEKAKNAQLWINPSYYTSYEALEKANPHYTKFEAFKNKNMYTFANTKGATGGVLYYELGIARPDLVLKDIIKVCHPELLENYTPYFFKPLE
ncbi:ABC transporter substrate-binding protein [Xanthomarina sp. F1114]|uniref:ABC transporter substrate-binding protein n=1 Tax=Xanthomarina sp. F1114 TaxID=2996019 RepID=UPI002B21D4FB|nr:ABC transporter substrate-binding protein [Xanthomarina sp. F1114]